MSGRIYKLRPYKESRDGNKKDKRGKKCEKPEIHAFIFVFALFIFFASLFIGMN
jgi:hypothetical protein